MHYADVLEGGPPIMYFLGWNNVDSELGLDMDNYESEKEAARPNAGYQDSLQKQQHNGRRRKRGFFAFMAQNIASGAKTAVCRLPHRRSASISPCEPHDCTSMEVSASHGSLKAQPHCYRASGVSGDCWFTN